jgi:hypothetical protein
MGGWVGVRLSECVCGGGGERGGVGGGGWRERERVSERERVVLPYA